MNFESDSKRTNEPLERHLPLFCDDTIKTYGSDISVSGVVVWKTKTAPVIQSGWRASRNLSNVVVDGADVIHMRYSSKGSHPSIIGANQVYPEPEDKYNTAELSNTVRDLYIRNIRAEGIGGNLMRIFPLANYDNVVVENVSLEGWSVRSTGIFEGEFPVVTDGDGTAVSVTNFVIRNFTGVVRPVAIDDLQ